MPGKQFTFRAKTANVSMWQQLGADIVGLANNHCFDYGEDAFLDTLSTLQGANIPYVGAGKNLEEAMQPQFFLVGGMKIGYVACTRAEKYILTPEAGETSPGVLRCYDPELAVQAIQTASEQCDYLVVYVHWGTEGSTVLEQAQTDLATRFTEAGADLIVGAHPHILQGAGWRKDTPVLYSLCLLYTSVAGRGIVDLHFIHPGGIHVGLDPVGHGGLLLLQLGDLSGDLLIFVHCFAQFGLFHGELPFIVEPPGGHLPDYCP